MRALRTARLFLEPQAVAHADEMFAVLGDPAIYEFENEAPASIEWLRERYRRLESRRSADGRERWLNWVVRRRDSHLIGYVQATVFPDGKALIGYEFNSAHWGQGYARESVEALLRELAESYGVTTAGAIFKRANARSRRLLERIGMTTAEAGAFPSVFAAPTEDAMAMTLPQT
jgi:RimJ/RimL family protein N-acetyltransferase